MYKLLVLLGVTSLAGCTFTDFPLPGNESAPDGHSSRNALDWAGTYQALMPCADCAAILTTLTLNEDGSYELKRLFVGEDGSLFDDRGRFSWSEDGARITLDIGDAPAQYLVQENRIVQLDLSGQPITGNLAGRYILHQVSDPDPLITSVSYPLFDTRWELATLRGQDLPPALPEKPWFVLGRDGTVSGFAGCNSFSGTYTVEGLQLRFNELASTLRGCLDPAMNDALVEVLREVDNYTRSSNTLSLNRARMAPLAQLEASVPR
jgi:copper homeostasis protein (lipoprotein)